MIHVIAAICGWPEALLFLRIVRRHLPLSLYTNWCLHQEMYLQVMELSIRWAYKFLTVSGERCYFFSVFSVLD